MPVSGMQYTQRKLQRSVTEIRRYSMLRPNWSRSASDMDVCPGGIDPLTRSVDVVLELPDRNARLELLDHIPARLVRGPAMRMRDDDCHARLAEAEHAEPVL